MTLARSNYRTTRDIVIPAGTILMTAANERGGNQNREAFMEMGKDFTGVFLVQAHPDALASGFIEEIKL